MEWREIEARLDDLRTRPTADDLIAAYVGFKPPKTIEQQWAEGVMGPEDVIIGLKRSGGKIEY